jgi:hypothetical protein
MGTAARARAAAHYSLESNADRLVEVYRRLVPDVAEVGRR